MVGATEAAVGEGAGFDLGGLSDDALAARLVDLHEERNRLDAAIVAATGCFDARSCGARDGARTTAAWVAARTGATYHRAKVDTAFARALRAMPVTEAAFTAGRLSREQVDALIKARDGLEEWFAACEDVLVDEVAGATVSAGTTFLRRWVAEVRDRYGVPDGEGPEPDAATGVHLSPTFEGTWRLDGTLTAEQGEVIANAIDAVTDEMFRTGRFHHDDGLTLSERKAIALVEVVTRGTNGGDDDGTARPLVLGVLDLRDNADGEERDPLFGPTFSTVPLGAQGPRTPGVLAGMTQSERSGVIDRATVERWICEGTFQPVSVGPGADQINMGRKARVATRAQRRALRVRDGHCVFPGCSAPPSQCQAHHIVWWEHDGPTDLSNLVLVCRWHHKVVHDQGFTIERTDGRVVVRRPDGTQVTDVRSVRCNHRRVRPPPPAGRDPDPDRAHVEFLIRHRVHDLINQAAYRRTTAAG